MNEPAHAPFPPSSAEQWGNCSGWSKAIAGMPDKSDQRAFDGTASHWVGAEVLLNIQNAGRGPVLCSDFIGKQAPNGIVIDDEMAEGAQVWVDDVIEVCQRFNALDRLRVEHRVYMPDIHPDNWGTTDTALYLPERNLLFDWDYKFGHRSCKPDSLQQINYVKGLANEFGIDGQRDQQTTVVLRVVQPFCYYVKGPVREWSGLMSDLRAHWNYLSSKAYEATHDPKLSTGPWCRDCKALGKCSATRKARYNFIELVNEPYEMDDMTAADMAVERQILQDGLAVAKARLEAIEDELKHRIQAGATDSPLTIEAVPGREKWAVPAPQAKALFLQFGVDIGKEDVLTPGQSLKKAPAEVRAMLTSIIKKFTTRNTAITLVPVADSRNARAFQKRS